MCVNKGVSRFVAALTLVLLPYGLLSVITGHLLLDLLIYLRLAWLARSDDDG